MKGRQDDIPQDVRAFIADYLDSVVQLETLLMLHGAPEREWEAADVARDLRIDRAWAEGQLAGLCEQGLAARDDPGGEVRRYRYAPASAAARAAVDGLSRAYAERRVTVISLIFAKPADNLRAFSDAFRIRKEKEGDDRG